MSKWSTTNDKRSYPRKGEWRIETRRFNVNDGTHFFQVKFARNDWSFVDPRASYFNWHSKPPRKQKEFTSHQVAYEWGLAEIEKRDAITMKKC